MPVRGLITVQYHWYNFLTAHTFLLAGDIRKETKAYHCVKLSALNIRVRMMFKFTAKHTVSNRNSCYFALLLSDKNL